MAATLTRNSKSRPNTNGKSTPLARGKARIKNALPVEEKLLTAEEYWATCDIENTELIDGKVVTIMPPGGEHGEIAGVILSFLSSFVRKQKLGRVFVETGYQLNTHTLRSPDISFVEYSRLPDGRAPRAFIEGAPTLAVEVVSPSDLWSEIEAKVQLYLEAETDVVWIVDPQTQTVTIRTQTESRVLDKSSTLHGEPILPGFKLSLKEIFDI